MNEIDGQLLLDYVATANNKEYGGDWNVINSKFPEFKDIDRQLLVDYVATANNPEYKGDYAIINSKFPEFFKEQPVKKKRPARTIAFPDWFSKLTGYSSASIQ